MNKANCIVPKADPKNPGSKLLGTIDGSSRTVRMQGRKCRMRAEKNNRVFQ